MSNIPVPQARYELLKDESRVRIMAKKKFCFVSAIILLPIAFIGMILLVINLHYFLDGGFQLPKYYQSKEFPSQWIERAIKYSSLNENISNPRNLVTKFHKNVQYNNLNNYKLVCYYSMDDSESSKNYLSTGKIDPFLCTHVNVGFLSISNNVLHITPSANRSLTEVVMLKKVNKNLKVLMSIGGGSSDSGFPNMVFNHTNRKEFIRSVITTIKHFKLDGVDLDWEFPNGDKKQRMHFTQLLHEIREEIKRHTEKHKFILSVAVAAPAILIDSSYDVSYMNEYVDYINLMSYDFHFYTKFTPFTGLNAPLYNRMNDDGFFMTLNINYSAYYWHELGMDKNKIIIGLPTYGHSFKLLNPDNTGIMAPAVSYGKVGSQGFVDYTDVCWFLNYYQIKAIFDMDSRSPYATKGDEWISFDDLQSLTYKTEFVKSNNFGGAMILSLNTDDHRGECQKPYRSVSDRFPLTRKVKSVLYDDQL